MSGDPNAGARRARWRWLALILLLLAARQLAVFHGLSHPNARVELSGFSGHQLGDGVCEALDHLATVDTPVAAALPLPLRADGAVMAQRGRPLLGGARAWRRGARGPPQA